MNDNNSNNSNSGIFLTNSKKWSKFMNNTVTKSITESFGHYYMKLTMEMERKHPHKTQINRNNIIRTKQKDNEKNMYKFITYIADSSILVYDNKFIPNLIPFKDIDFVKHPLHNKYVNIIINYNDDDIVDKILEMISSVKEGVVSIIKTLKSAESGVDDGCGWGGQSCLGPKLAIRCFQLLSEEVSTLADRSTQSVKLWSYKPVGNINTVSLGKGKGFMSQQYKRISDDTPSTNNAPSIPKKKKSSKRFPGSSHSLVIKNN